MLSFAHSFLYPIAISFVGMNYGFKLSSQLFEDEFLLESTAVEGQGIYSLLVYDFALPASFNIVIGLLELLIICKLKLQLKSDYS